MKNNYENKNQYNTKNLPVMFSIKECRDLLPEIYNITEKFYNKIEKISIKLLDSNDEVEKRLHRSINSLINMWADKMTQLNVNVTGLWSVNFDSGDGIYYCWKFPENDIKYFYSYEKSLKSRRPISLLEGDGKENH